MMLTLPVRAWLASIIVGLGQAEDPQVQWRIYDMRDLLGTITAGRMYDSLDSTATEETVGNPFDPPQRRRVAARSVEMLDGIVSNLCHEMAAAYNDYRLLPGVYAIQAEPPSHEILSTLLEKLRALYDESYEIALMWYQVSANEPITVGTEARPTKSVRRHHVVVPGRTPTPIEVGSRYSVVTRLDPVVANSAVGYAPGITEVRDGLQLVLVAGAGPSDGQSVRLNLHGQLTSVDVQEVNVPEIGHSLALPHVHTRSIQAGLDVPMDVPTIVSVIDSVNTEMVVVIAARVRRVVSTHP